MSVNGLSAYTANFYEYLRWNGQLVYTNASKEFYDEFATEEYDRFWMETKLHFLLHANIDMGLFVIEEVDMKAKGEAGPVLDYPVYPVGSWRKRRVYVWWRGVEYTLFLVNMPFHQAPGFPDPWSYEKFPTIWNQFPWILDTAMPQPEDYEPAPYNVSGTHTEWGWMFPFMEFYEPPVSWFKYATSTYPTALDDIHSQLFPTGVNPNNQTLKTGFLQVFTDPITESWVVRCKNVIPLGLQTYTAAEWPYRALQNFSVVFTISFPDGGGDTVNYPNGKNTLYKIGSGVPSFNSPGAITETHII
jgi:hypothetical protein